MSFFTKNKQRKTVHTSLIFACAIGMLMLGWTSVQPVFAVLPTTPTTTIGLSASIFNNQNQIIANGAYEIRFALYSTNRETIDTYPSNTDTRLWEETQTINIKSGLIKAFLGSVNPFPADLDFQTGDYYIGMRIGTDSEMIPRKKLASVPSAINSQYFQGKTIGTNEGDIPLIASTGTLDVALLKKINQVGTITNGTWQGTVIADSYIANALTSKTYNGINLLTTTGEHTITLSSDVTIDQNLSLTSDVVFNMLSLTMALSPQNGGTGITSYQTGDILYASSETTLSKLGAGSDGQSLILSGGLPSWGLISGSGITVNSLDFTEFKDAMTLDASTDISIAGTNVFSFTNTGTGNSFVINDAAGDTTPFVIDASGNVGIGTTSPSQALSVQGNGLFSGNISAANITATGTLTLSNPASASIISTATSTPGSLVAFDLYANSGNPTWPTNGDSYFKLSNTVNGTKNQLLNIKSLDATTYAMDFVGMMRPSGFQSPSGNGGLIQIQYSGLVFPTAGITTYDTISTDGNLKLTSTVADSASAVGLLFKTTHTFNTTGDKLLAIQNNGTEAFTILGNGNVGIGTTNPGVRLQVSGDVKFSNTLYFGGNSDRISTSSDLGYMEMYSAQPVRINGSSVILQSTSGNVGIGTTSPSALLSLGNGSGAAGTTAALGINFGDPTANLYRSAAGTIKTDGTLSVVGGATFGGNVSANRFYPTDGIFIATGSYVTGAATDSNIIFQQRNFTTANTALTVSSGTASNSSGQFNAFAITPTYNQSGTAAATDLLINRTETAVGSGAQRLIDAQVGGVSKFVILNSGNVGIGTTSPGYPLDIYNQGVEAFQFQTAIGTPVAGQSLFFRPGGTGNGAAFGASSANFSVIAGSGNSVSFQTPGGATGARFNVDDSYSNYLSFTGAALGSNPILGTAGGSDANISLSITPKGTGNVIITNGNVGIGTASPSQLLTVFGSDSGTGGVLQAINTYSGSYVTAFNALAPNAVNAQFRVGQSLSNNGSAEFNFAYGVGNTSVFNLGMYGNPNIISYKYNGNVGIGTTSPAYALDVVGTVRATGGLVADAGGGSNNAFLSLTGRSGGVGATAQIYADYNGNLNLNPAGGAINLVNVSNLTLDKGSGSSNAELSLVGRWSGVGATAYLRANYQGGLEVGSASGQAINLNPGGTGAMTLLSNGNVGIGTTNPDFPLTVNGSLHFYSGAVNSYISPWNWDTYGSDISFNTHNAHGMSFRSQDTGNIDFQTAGTVAMSILNNGNVGIGTTNPGAKLQVTGASDIVQVLVKGYSTQTSRIFDIQDSNASSAMFVASGAYNPKLYVPTGGTVIGAGTASFENDRSFGMEVLDPLGFASGFHAAALLITESSDRHRELKLDVDPTNNLGIISTGYYGSGTGTYPGLSFRTGVNAVTILNNGNVGIGTTTPAAPLQVQGNVILGSSGTLGSWYFTQNAFSHYYGSDLTNPRFAYQRDTDPSGGSSGTLLFANNGQTFSAAGAGLGSPASGALAFFTSNGSALTEGMRINNQGNVGIGTTNPGYPLEVVSTLGANSVYTRLKSTNGGVQFANNNNIGEIDFLTSAGAVFSSLFNTTGGWRWTGNFNISGGSSIGSTYIATVPPTNGLIVEGNVGVGTTNPGQKLEVSSASNQIRISNSVAPTSYFTEISENWDASNPFNITVNSYGVVMGVGKPGGYTGTAIPYINGYYGSGILGDDTFGIFVQGHGATAGNVGIGTTSPTAKLHVVGDTYLNGTVTVDGSYLGFLNGAFIAGPHGTGDFTAGTGNAGYGFENDANTGMYQVAGDKIGFSTAGYGRMVIDNSGNVGIGTTSPGAKLDITGSTGIIGRFTQTGTWTGSEYALSVSGYSNLGGLRINAADIQRALYNNTSGQELGFGTNAGNITFSTDASGATRMVVIKATTGNVGIGETGPGSKLSVLGGMSIGDATYSTVASPIGGAIIQGNVGIGTTNPGYKLDVSGAAQFLGNLWLVHSNSNTPNDPISYFQIKDRIDGIADGNSAIRLASSNVDHYISFLTNNTESMRINSGNVGIGTTVPGALLDVAGGKSYFRPGATTLSIEDHAVAGTGNNIKESGANLDFYVGGARTLTVSANNLSVRDNGSFQVGSNFNVNGTTGNVGIGTTNPTNFKLQVAGNVGPDATNAYNLGAAGSNWGCLYYNGGTTGTCASDARLKNNIADFSFGNDPLGKIAGLKLRTFSYKSDDSNSLYHGLIAQEVQQVAPELVTTSSDGYFAVKYGDIQWLTLSAVQQLNQNVITKNTQNDTIITDLTLKTDANITTLAGLQTSVDTQLTVIGITLNEQKVESSMQKEKNNEQDIAIAILTTDSSLLTTKFDNLQTDMNTQASRITTLETQMQSLVDFYTTFNMGNIIAKDTSGNIDLTIDSAGNPILLGGKLKATILETGALMIDVIDPLAPTIGRGKILSGDTKVIIETKSVKTKSHIIVTPRDVTTEPLAAIGVIDSTSFTVEVPTPTTQDISFDWWIVEEK